MGTFSEFVKLFGHGHAELLFAQMGEKLISYLIQLFNDRSGGPQIAEDDILVSDRQDT